MEGKFKSPARSYPRLAINARTIASGHAAFWATFCEQFLITMMQG